MGSPIQGLGVLRRSLNLLPTAHPTSACGSLRQSLSEDQLQQGRTSQHLGTVRREGMTLEEEASLVLGQLLNSSAANWQ